MSSYVELIKQDVYHHDSYDASFWPSSVSELAQSLRNELKIPTWLKSGSLPYTNQRVIDMLHQLRASDDPSNGNLWDDVDGMIDNDAIQQLHVVFNTALIDCARIQAVIKAESLTNTPSPKESFLVILVRNAILDSHPRISSLEDVPVVLPRHFSGEHIAILHYMTKSIYAPLVISICQEMPVRENVPSLGPHSSGGNSNCESELFQHSPPTMSEFMDACERPKTPEEIEDELEEDVLPPQFDAYFISFPPSTIPPSVCHIPVLCMAEEEQLPVLMSSLLYQRRVWHINDPLVGLAFSKYDTVIRLFVGWLEDDISLDRVLPRVHLGEVGTPVKLDLSSPSVALVVSRLLCSLQSRVSAVDDSVRQSVGVVISETQSPSSSSWRIDTGIQKEDSAPFLENNYTRDMITRWVKSQTYSEVEDTMPPRRRAVASSHDSTTSTSPPPHQSTSAQSSYVTSPSSVASGEKDVAVLLREPREHSDGVPTLDSRLSCSAFAATNEGNNYRVFRWMFDRRVVPQSVPSDSKFREEYSAMTGFIWPETWYRREDLPSVDAALEPCVQELLKSVAALKTRPNAVKCVPAAQFPFDLRILEQSFSAIFQASRRSREKKMHPENVYEAAWRHDHDRLLYDFFIRLVQSRRDDATITRVDDVHCIAHLEDPFSRPALETTLRFSKSNNLQSDGEQQFQEVFRDLIMHKAPDRRSWLQGRGGSLNAALEDDEHLSYIFSQFNAWRRETNTATESRMIATLGQHPSTGRCDALGRLLVELPNVMGGDVGQFPLVVRGAGKDSGGTVNDVQNSVTRSKPRSDHRRDQGKRSTKMSSSSLTIPDGFPGPATLTNGTHYTMLSSAIRTSMESLDEEQTRLVESMDALSLKTQNRRLEANATYLELPILCVEYKKASGTSMKGTNQLRMYLTTSVKFLQAVGIRNVPVYGVQTDGPIVALPAAVLRDDDFVYLFERLVEMLDISTPLGAWHYATILCRLAQYHAKVLEKRFEEVREDLVASLLAGGNQMEEWTMDHQIASLKTENRAKSPPQKEK